MNLESEELNMEKIPEWIYAPTNFSPELEKTFAAVEKALGFKLFIWQKTFIANTTYRRSGRTTAEIRHKEWQKRGLMAPLQPQETPEYSFSDLQMNLYNTIYL